MPDPAPKLRPKAIINLELHEDGTMVIEDYVNGARTRTMLLKGNEWAEIKATLVEKLTRLQSKAELERNKAQKVRESLDNLIVYKRQNEQIVLPVAPAAKPIALQAKIKPKNQPKVKLKTTSKPMPKTGLSPASLMSLLED